MITSDEPNSLIDWSGTVVNGANNIPLIPLPSFENRVQFSEDNPFDAVERQVYENDPLFDVFNLNLSFDNEADSQNNSKNNSSLDDSISKEIAGINLNDVWENKINISSTNDFGCDERVIDDGMCSVPAKVGSESDKSQLETSAVSSLSNISDFKEMVMNRISNCINQALHQTNDVDSFLKQMTSKSTSPVLENTDLHSGPPSIMNDCLIVYDMEESIKLEKRIDADFLKGFGDDGEDIQSIVPTWDEVLLSSSDEENEKHIGSSNEKSRSFHYRKKSPVSHIGKAKDARVPLVFQDPNIRIKKNNTASKQGPLKATIPLSSMKKIEERRAALNTSDNKTMYSKKPKATPSLTSKQKRWSNPVATSTPQSLKQIQVNFQKFAIPKKSTPDEYSRPSSPDSTSGSRINSRINSITKSTLKSHIRKQATNAVSSSTNVTFPRLTSKTPKDFKNTSVTETVSKSLVGAKSSLKNIRNKENILPFRYK